MQLLWDFWCLLAVVTTDVIESHFCSEVTMACSLVVLTAKSYPSTNCILLTGFDAILSRERWLCASKGLLAVVPTASITSEYKGSWHPGVEIKQAALASI